LQIYAMYYDGMIYNPDIKTSYKLARDRIKIEPYSGHIQIKFYNEVIADSQNTFGLYEPGHEPVLYFPNKDVRMKWLEQVPYTTYCPYKGKASYWTLNVGKNSVKNAAWSYENPIPSVSTIKGYIAFHQDNINITQHTTHTGENI